MAIPPLNTEPLDRICFGSSIGPHAKGLRLVEFLSGRFKYFNEEQWAQHITTRDVLVNGGTALPEQILTTGDRVEYFAMKRPEPRVPRDISIVYQDEDLLVVNKPPHIPVHPTGRYLRNTLIHVLQTQTRLKFLILCHRLDRETSGLCVLAKTPLAKDKMYWAFYKGEVAKTYWGLVWGKPRPPSGVIDAPLGTAIGSRIRIKQAVNGTDAKTARTKYHTLGTKWIESPEWEPPRWPALVKEMKDPTKRGPWPISLMECTPVTGRTNQIRVHLTELGCGIVGDKLYDPDENVFMNFKDNSNVLDDDKRTKGFLILSPELKRRLVLDAHALHARKLTFRHPRTGKSLTLEAPPPRSWHGLYEKK
jgi:23S rRNA pseudouridine1911/1915/1917 synthase